jgi:hypothetical protein
MYYYLVPSIYDESEIVYAFINKRVKYVFNPYNKNDDLLSLFYT